MTLILNAIWHYTCIFSRGHWWHTCSKYDACHIIVYADEIRLCVLHDRDARWMLWYCNGPAYGHKMPMLLGTKMATLPQFWYRRPHHPKYSRLEELPVANAIAAGTPNAYRNFYYADCWHYATEMGNYFHFMLHARLYCDIGAEDKKDKVKINCLPLLQCRAQSTVIASMPRLAAELHFALIYCRCSYYQEAFEAWDALSRCRARISSLLRLLPGCAISHSSSQKNGHFVLARRQRFSFGLGRLYFRHHYGILSADTLLAMIRSHAHTSASFILSFIWLIMLMRYEPASRICYEYAAISFHRIFEPSFTFRHSIWVKLTLRQLYIIYMLRLDDLREAVEIMEIGSSSDNYAELSRFQDVATGWAPYRHARRCAESAVSRLFRHGRHSFSWCYFYILKIRLLRSWEYCGSDASTSRMLCQHFISHLMDYRPACMFCYHRRPSLIFNADCLGRII